MLTRPALKKQFRNLHPAALVVYEALRASRTDQYDFLRYQPNGPISGRWHTTNFRVTQEQLKPMILLLDVLIRMCQQTGDESGVKHSRSSSYRGPEEYFVLIFAGEPRGFKLWQLQMRREHIWTNKEKAARAKYEAEKKRKPSFTTFPGYNDLSRQFVPQYDYLSKPEFRLELDALHRIPGITRRAWTFSLDKLAEPQLDKLYLGLNSYALKSREECALREEEMRQRALEAQRQQELAQFRAVEASQRQALEAEAEAWKKAEDIRRYVAARIAYETNLGTIGEATRAWREWALAYANAIDPLSP